MPGLIVHEWIEEFGGSEKVLEQLSLCYPEADVFTLWTTRPRLTSGREVAESLLARTPLAGRKAAALPFMSAVWSAKSASDYDWVLSSSHAFAHHVASRSARGGDMQRFSYVHTPARYIWEPTIDSRGRGRLVRAAGPLLRRIDRRKAAQGTSFAANSEFVQRRISRCWEQPSRVIYPPVDICRIQRVSDWSSRLTGEESEIVAALPDHYIIGASRFVAYKRLDEVIAVGERNEVPVVIAGSGEGPERTKLVTQAERASVPVHIVEKPSDALLFTLISNALAFVFPAIEDFGIIPAESIALGTPVLVHSVGGAREIVENYGGGAILDFDRNDTRGRELEFLSGVDIARARSEIRALDVSRFQRDIVDWVGQ